MTSPQDSAGRTGQDGPSPDPAAVPTPAAGPAAAPAAAAAAPTGSPAPARLPAQHVVRRTRVGGVWVASALFAVVLLLLLIFILENGQRANVAFFGAHGHLPLGVALLLAAVLGVLLVVIPGTGRIMQLRWVSRRHRKAEAGTALSTQPAPTADSASGGASQP
jgi:uncharacterized integral membrane protein